ncbi:IS3 family transposase [Pseudovibrio ascidiaceicola]|uniref:IS3 family transposase n=1 Tax=Pseudovibrio ascidiaceicola TaxID=285279 RepID=UPI003D369A10
MQREFECFSANTVWLADIFYCATEESWLYVAAIKDMVTREIVGWAMVRHMKAGLCCDALKMALARRGSVTGLVHHADRCSQYCSDEYRKLLRNAGIRQSMSRKGQGLDNAPMESFIASLKKELVYRTTFKSRQQAKATIFEYIEVFYNRQRRHSAISYKTPYQAYQQKAWKMAACLSATPIGQVG